MWNEFMQMGAPAAFAILCLGAGPSIVLIVLIANRTIQRGQQLKHIEQLQQQAAMAKQIENKKIQQNVGHED